MPPQTPAPRRHLAHRRSSQSPRPHTQQRLSPAAVHARHHTRPADRATRLTGASATTLEGSGRTPHRATPHMTCLNRGSRSPTALEKLGGRNCTNRVAPRPLSPPPSPQPRRSGARTSPWWNPTEWRPSRPETVAGSPPWSIAWLAQPCRRSCSRIFGNSACLERRSNCLVIRAGWISSRRPAEH